MRNKSKNIPNNYLQPLKSLLLFSLVFFILIKPIANTTILSPDMDGELIELMEDEEGKEKEKEIADEEDQEYYYSHFANSIFQYTATLVTYKYVNYLSEYNPDIHIPPPDFS